MTDLSSPEYAVADPNLIPVSGHPKDMAPIPPSRMFTIKEALKKYQLKVGAGSTVFDASQGDGGASLPGVPQYILETALEIQIEHGTSYDKPFGTDLFRQVAAEDYWQLDSATGWGPGNIIFAQGGRDGLNKAYLAMSFLGYGRMGDVVVVSRVPWISYNWGPYGIGMNVMRAPGDPEQGWRYTPEGIKACVEMAAADGRKVAGIVITSPDNPTGRTLPIEEQITLGKTAIEAGIPFVLYDWMYHYVTDGGPSDLNKLLLAFTPEERKSIMVLDGITKSLGASNIRSAHLLADEKVIKFINTQSSHGVIPSFYAQAVAIAAYRQGFAEAAKSIIEPCSASRKVLRSALEQTDMPFVMGDGYYAFIDLGKYIEAGEFGTSEGIGAYLAEEHGVAVVPGSFFSSAGDDWVRFSYALPPERTAAAFERMISGLQALG
ncbi:MAG: pyridoxal phosphate-dependent aminotransferase [Anaerolineae bacterium]|nr:pyridoxal phosphate-dependent aminotransferase [Anaerolineae bacterium]MCA9888391.1 pyridoxal phosphate-dependent aminotransferase [Anaerolineae bacterium]MCA9891807.1 pyridoxal phosphate-dependent aminotransferase [Anaerolineae bacterium]